MRFGRLYDLLIAALVAAGSAAAQGRGGITLVECGGGAALKLKHSGGAGS